MKKLPFTVKPYRDKNRPHLKFTVRAKIDGKWDRKFFETQAEAKTYAHLKNTELLQYGADAANTPTWLRIMAQNCQEQLARFKKTVQDATAHYVKYLQEQARSCPVERLFEELVTFKRCSGLSRDYLYTLRTAGDRLAAAFPGKLMSDFKTRDINDFLLSMKDVSAYTVINYRTRLVTAFAFALTQGYCSENPALESVVPKVVDKAVEILRPEELARLLAAAAPEILPALAIGAFAGIRSAELARLDWREVDLEGGFIEVTARKAKSAKRRLIRIQPCLAEWLRPFAKTSGKIAYARAISNVQRREMLRRAGLKSWPKNALRHSFASYHLAHFKDAAALALEMGHTTTGLIFSHYREVVRPEAGAEYWSIRPNSRPETSSVYAFKPEAWPWCVKVFPFSAEKVESVGQLAAYFHVSPATIHRWFKLPACPNHENAGQFFLPEWRKFVRALCAADGTRLPYKESHYFVARHPSCINGATNFFRFFETSQEAETFASEYNRKRLTAELHPEAAPNVIEFAVFGREPSPLSAVI